MSAVSNTLLTIDMITYKALQLFRNSNSFLRTISRSYDSSFAVEGAKIGSTLRVRLPIDPTVRSTAALALQAVVEKNITVTLATQNGVDLAFTSVDKALSLDDYTDRILAPSVNNLAGSIAAQLMSDIAPSSSNFVAATSSGSVVSPTAKTFLQAAAVLSRMSAPQDGRHIVMSYDTQANLISSMSGLFNPQVKIAQQYTTGMLTQDTLGFETWAADQTTLISTGPTFSGHLADVAGATQSGSTITVGSLATDVPAGTVITIAGVNAVNRVTKVSTGSLMNFVVTADAASSGTSLHIYPALQGPDGGGAATSYQTVDVRYPADGADIGSVVKSAESYRVNLAYHESAATMVTADLFLPTAGVIAASRKVYDNVSMRVIEFYDGTNDQAVTRMDVLWGAVALRPEWMVRVGDVIS